MRVAYVTMQFPSPSETFAGTDIVALRARGVDVEVFTLRPRHRDHDLMIRERGLSDLPIHAFELGDFVRDVVALLTRPRLARMLISWNLGWHWRVPRSLLKCFALTPRAVRIFRQLTTGEFDVVHLFWGNFPAMVGLLVQRSLPGVVSSMFLGAYDLDRSPSGGWLPGSAAVARGADLVWTHAEANVPRLRSVGIPAERLRVVHRGINLDAFSTREGAAPRAPTIVTVGRLIELKRVDDALRVVAAVRERIPGVRLDIIGDGPERSPLEALARTLGIDDAVTFHGHLAVQDVAAHLRSASALLLMSRKDRLPNVVKEAMAAGAFCVVTATEGMDELVIHERTGYVVAIGDVPSAAQHLIDVLEDPRGHAEMVAAARTHVIDGFDASRAMGRYEHAWREAASRMAPPHASRAGDGASGGVRQSHVGGVSTQRPRS